MSTQTTDGPPSPAGSRPAEHRRAGGLPGERLPVPARQRRPALAALAAVLILGGAALAASLVLSSGQKRHYLLLGRNVAVGQKLAAADFLQQALSATDSTVFAPVPVSDYYPRVDGRTALVPLRKGSLLVEGTFGEALSPPRGLGELSLGVPEGRYPEGLTAGDVVRVLYTPGTVGPGPADGSSPGDRPLRRGATLVAAAHVSAVRENTAGQGGVIVGIQVRDEQVTDSPGEGMPAVAAANAVNAVSVVRLTPNHDYDRGSR
jgi:hypothetical protein